MPLFAPIGERPVPNGIRLTWILHKADAMAQTVGAWPSRHRGPPTTRSRECSRTSPAQAAQRPAAEAQACGERLTSWPRELCSGSGDVDGPYDRHVGAGAGGCRGRSLPRRCLALRVGLPPAICGAAAGRERCEYSREVQQRPLTPTVTHRILGALRGRAARSRGLLGWLVIGSWASWRR